MVVAWQVLDKDGNLITTCFKEKDAIRYKERMESKGETVRLDKIFDAHLKDRKPVVKKRCKKDIDPTDETPDGYFPVTIYVQTGDLIVSELGIATKHRGDIIENVTRMVVNTTGKIVPVISGRHNV